MTIEYSEKWGYPHVCRVLRLIEEIGSGLEYDQNVILYAAYIHDWGALPRYSQPGVEHALRSMQVAETEILPYTNLGERERKTVLDAIALHDYRDSRPAEPFEALLLREADMLDMIGVIGLARDLARGPQNLKDIYGIIVCRRDKIAGRFTLPRAQEIAAGRLAAMNQALNQLQGESFGFL
jgi:uncharacterized protein